METQSYANHTKRVPLFLALSGIIALTLLGSLVNLYESWGDHARLYSAALIVVMNLCLVLLFFFCRSFPLKAQDRAIRAEENLRHYVLTGKLLDSRIDVKQVVALRFAPDSELPDLAQRTVKEGLVPDAIKRAVKNWRADHDRL